MKKLATVFASFLLVLALVAPGWPWGNTTHQAGAYYLANTNNSLSGTLNTNALKKAFINANVCPDIGNLPLFQFLGLDDVIHDIYFANYLVSQAENDKQLATALAWGVHLKFDEIAHNYFVPDYDDFLHFQVEWAVSTIIYRDNYTGIPFDDDLFGLPEGPDPPQSWDNYNIDANFECCDPVFIQEAIVSYAPFYRGIVTPEMVERALRTLRAEVKLEHEYAKRYLNYWWNKYRFLPSLDLPANYHSSDENWDLWIGWSGPIHERNYWKFFFAWSAENAKNWIDSK